MKTKRIYETPLLELQNIAVESGIAGSNINEGGADNLPGMEEVETTWY